MARCPSTFIIQRDQRRTSVCRTATVSSLLLTAEQLSMLRQILTEQVPEVPAVAFGSRVTGAAHKWSDLDVMLLPEAPLPFSLLAELNEALMKSDPTVHVDVVDGSCVHEQCRRAGLREAAAFTDRKLPR